MKSKDVTMYGLLLALSFIGAYIKVPGMGGLDAMPAFLGAMWFGPWSGAILGFAGHMILSGSSGFPFGVMGHVLVAMVMALACACYGYIFHHFKKASSKAYILSCIGGWFVNVVVGSFVVATYTMFIGLNGPLSLAQAALGLIIALTPSAVLNMVLACASYVVVKKRMR